MTNSDRGRIIRSLMYLFGIGLCWNEWNSTGLERWLVPMGVFIVATMIESLD